MPGYRTGVGITVRRTASLVWSAADRSARTALSEPAGWMLKEYQSRWPSVYSGAVSRAAAAGSAENAYWAGAWAFLVTVWAGGRGAAAASSYSMRSGFQALLTAEAGGSLTSVSYQASHRETAAATRVRSASGSDASQVCQACRPVVARARKAAGNVARVAAFWTPLRTAASKAPSGTRPAVTSRNRRVSAASGADGAAGGAVSGNCWSTVARYAEAPVKVSVRRNC